MRHEVKKTEQKPTTTKLNYKTFAVGCTNGCHSIGSGVAGGYGAAVSGREGYGGTWRAVGPATGIAEGGSLWSGTGASSGPWSGNGSGSESGNSSECPVLHRPGCMPSHPTGREQQVSFLGAVGGNG